MLEKTDINKCTGINKFQNVKVKEGNFDLKGKVWSREKYWQAVLFTFTHGIDSSWVWFSSNRKCYRKTKK